MIIERMVIAIAASIPKIGKEIGFPAFVPKSQENICVFMTPVSLNIAMIQREIDHPMHMIIDENDTYLVFLSGMRKQAAETMNSTQEVNSINPTPVETALPPPKFRKME